MSRFARMSKLTAFFLVWSCSFCYAVQVSAKDAGGNVIWKDSPSWRDRSVVPTPPSSAVQAYKKRVEIPHPYTYPGVVKHVYIGPENSIENERKLNKKKNIIQKIFFSLPVGAELPLYYTDYAQKQAETHKKSTVASSEASDNEGSRYFSEETNGPFRTNTWGLKQQLAAENEELSPEIETRTIARQNMLPSEAARNEDLSPEIEARTIARQNILPSEGGMRYHGIGGEYLRPRMVDRNKIFRNTGQFFKRPSRTQRILNVYRRSKVPELKKIRRDLTKIRKLPSSGTTKPKNGYIIKGKDVKKSGLPKGESLDDIMKKLKPEKRVKQHKTIKL